MGTPSLSREAAFQELLGVSRHSFASYVVESSSPVVVDEADQKLMKLFEELYEKERYYVERAYELLEKSLIRPLPPTYSLKASNFNFLRPMKLAEEWTDQVSKEIARLEALQGRVPPDDPCAKDFDRLAADFLALRRDSLKRVSELRAALAPKKEPVPPANAPAPAAKPAS
jgi:hypothetical protein